MQSRAAKIDDMSKRFLEEVKKGRVRKFVMIKEGVQIDRLFVFKKGPVDRYIRIARQDGIRGEAFWGVIRGDGIDIRFELSRADGFTSPPGTEIRLKEFLKEAGGFKFEPSYALVDVLAVVEDRGDEDSATEDSIANSELLADQDASESSAEKFVRLLKAILPHVKRALSIDSSASEELRRKVREAQELGRLRQFDTGLATLQVVGTLTKRTLAGLETASNRRQLWQDGLARLEPIYQQHMNADAPNAEKLRVIMDYAKNQAEQHQFVKALVGLKRLEPLLYKPI